MKVINFYSRLTLLIISIILISCNSSKKVASQKIETENYFIIGSGGGFTGIYTQYKVNDSGLIESYDFENNTYHQYKSANKNQVDGFFNQIIALDLSNTDYSIPGNISDYIDVLNADQTINHIVWANETNDFNPEIIKFHKNVMQFIKE